MSRDKDGFYLTRFQAALLSIMILLSTIVVVSFAAIPQNTVQHDRGITFPTINATRGYYIGTQNVTTTLKYPGRSGIVLSCSNGTWIAHGLQGDPGTTGTITLSLRGPSAYNATFILRVPTVLSSNVTHFQIEFLAWETGTWTLVPVTPVEGQTIYWYAVYNPP